MMPAPFEQQVTFLYTRNWAQSELFYRDWLGLERVLTRDGCHIYRVARANEAYIGLWGRYITQGEVEMTVSLVTHDVDGWYRHLCHRGCSPETVPTHDLPSNSYYFNLRDLSGNRLKIVQFRDPDWPAPKPESHVK